MRFYKKVIKRGNSLTSTWTKEDIELLGLKQGLILDITVNAINPPKPESFVNVIFDNKEIINWIDLRNRVENNDSWN